MSKSNVLKLKWVTQMSEIAHMINDTIPLTDIQKSVEKIYDDNVKNPNCVLDNNYTFTRENANLLSFIDWWDTRKPITCETGVMFKPHGEVPNPDVQMLLSFQAKRKANKKRMYEYEIGSAEYNKFNRAQNEDKVDGNSYYGASGNETADNYNLYAATSVTKKGQALISLATLAFEDFLANNVKFLNISECLSFLRNIIHEEYEIDVYSHIENIPRRVEVKMRLIDKFLDYPSEKDIDILDQALATMSERELIKIYYKNNLFEALLQPSIKMQLEDVFNTLYEENTFYQDPYETPEIIKYKMDNIWTILNDLVFYNHPIINRIYRVKSHIRHRVLVIDTDSNFVLLDPWYCFIRDNIKMNLNPEVDEVRHSIINVAAFICDKMISTTMATFTKQCHVPKAERFRIAMKNEYLYKRVLTTSSKKNYAAIMELKEGKFAGNKLDMKGLPIMKTSLRKETRTRLTNILTDKIMKADEIDISNVVRELMAFEVEIQESINSGQKEYYKPVSVKEMESYKDPYRIQGIKGALVWNALYPSKEIQLPAKLDLVKVTLDDKKNLERLKNTYPEIYATLESEILSDEHFKKGFNIIALPKDVREIPEWLYDFVDVNTIVNDNTTVFEKILQSLGGAILSSTKYNTSFSNIVEL